MNKFSITLITASFMTFGAVALAQSGQNPANAAVSPLEPIYACANKTDPTERLACFDAAVATIRAKEAKSEIVTFDKQRVEKVRREAFGFSLPSLPKLGFPAFGGAPKAEGKDQSVAAAAVETDIEEQSFTVASTRESAGRVVLTLENGQVWRLTEAGELNAPSRPPYKVKIRTAAMGSFILTVEGRNKGYRVRRVE
ncbi:MAG: hypothetical protein O9286_06990 [Aquidulcibacter sp.]|jgi:hypothetical protein|uniref:hypothetical protein n=1 Tax=Aquidulcibacter sp. TaxID=2052990 RepID=UPI0022BB3853|nr:hypothetical protein [Aquidulcibacter sp.]